MAECSEIKKINGWLSFYFIQFDTSPPAIIEGRVHPIQFSNSVTRINAAGRSFREKKLWLQIMFCLALAIIVIYPFLDTDYYLPILLLFATILLVDYIYYSTLEAKCAALLLDVVQQENDLFVNSGMRLRYNPYTTMLEMEVVTQLSRLQDPSFQALHNAYRAQLNAPSAASSPASSCSSSSAFLVDVDFPSRLPSCSSFTQLVDADFDPPSIPPSPQCTNTPPQVPTLLLPTSPPISLLPAAPAQLVDDELSALPPLPPSRHLNTARRSSFSTPGDNLLLPSRSSALSLLSNRNDKPKRRVSINEITYIINDTHTTNNVNKQGTLTSGGSTELHSALVHKQQQAINAST